MSLLPFFQWSVNLPMSKALQASVWMFPVIQASHLFIMSIFAGSILMVDLRLLGLGMKNQSVAQVTRQAQPWLIGSLLGMVATGIPQFTTNAMRYYPNPAFWPKMEILLVAVIFTFALRHRAARVDEARVGGFWFKAGGVTSLVLWTAVLIGGRLIGLV